MNKFPEYSIINALSYGSDLKLKNSMPFEENASLILKSLSERNFVIMFPFYWTHIEVANFSLKYQNRIKANDLEWYLLELRNVLNNRKDEEIHWVERVNFFHSIACTRFLNENQVDNEKLIHTLVSIAYNKTKFYNIYNKFYHIFRVHDSKAVFYAFDMINSWFKQLREEKKKIYTTFDYDFFFTGIRYVFETDHAVCIGKCLWMIYNNFILFSGKMKEKKVLI